MNTKTVRELRSIAKDKGLRGYYKFMKADLNALLLEQPTEEMSTHHRRVACQGRMIVLKRH